MPPKIPPFQPLAPNDQLYKIACKANELFEKGNYTSAVLEYSKGLEVAKPFSEGRRSMDFIALLLSNRSASYFMIKDFENARKDAEKCCGLRPYWGKGHYRRAEALCAQSKYDEALYAYETAVKLDPSNHDFRRCLLRTCLLKENQTMGLSVIQLLPGRDIAISKRLSPIQNKINQFAIEMRNFIYIIADTDSRQCIVVDACWDTAGIIKIIKKHNLTIIGTIVTHYHFDHVGGIPPPPFDQFRIKVSGLATMLKKFPHIKAYIHVNDIPYLKESNPNISHDQIYPSTDDLEITLGTRTHLKFIHTPGHSSGSQCVLVNSKRLISGDTLFIGNCGRLDLPGADPKQMYNTLQKLRNLPDFVVVLPGHNYGGDWTTINQEKEIGALKEQTYEEWIRKKQASLASSSDHQSSATTSFDSGVHHV